MHSVFVVPKFLLSVKYSWEYADLLRAFHNKRLCKIGWGVGGGGQTECIMGNWKIENGKYATRVPDVALYEFYECSVLFIMT